MKGVTPLTCGELSQLCPHCGARLFSVERNTFCCSGGKNYVRFEDYYEPPSAALLKIYRSANFSADSRRYNRLFCLAQHAIRASSEEKEVKFWQRKNSFLKIQGTMYRVVFPIETPNPIQNRVHVSCS